ncbi:MAG: hypothetical protein E5W26_13110 [Mesorhizobium sp.]|nr:MAG: hypothetical protein E5W26_13110 [Mesorhizobium sp.]
MKAGIFSFPKASGQRGSGVHERGRLASKRDQQKWFPVLRLIARPTKVQRSAKVVSGFATDRAPDKGPAISKSGFLFWCPRGWHLRILASSFGLAY